MTKTLLITLTCVCIVANTRAQQAPPPPVPPGPPQISQNMMPGEAQRFLAKYSGMWRVELKMWDKADAPAMIGSAMGRFDMIFGGRYLRGTPNGMFMGRPYNGESTIGYDNSRKVFLCSWIDNQGTGLTYLEGKWIEPNSKIEFKGKMTDPATGIEMQVREVIKFMGDNVQTTEMWKTENGKEFKSMEMTMTRS